MKKRDLLSLQDISSRGILSLLKQAEDLKDSQKKGSHSSLLRGKVLGLYFSKPSTRTRISFQVGMAQLGGTTIVLPPSETQIGRGESLEDTARVLSRYIDGIVVRTFKQSEVESWAHSSSVPVINGLSDLYHPCQILSDLMTIKERTGRLNGIKIAYIGDGNNIAHSWLLAAGILGLDLTLAVPRAYAPDKEIFKVAQLLFKGSGEPPRVVRKPEEAAEGADILYTDVWTSMGQEGEKKKRAEAFKGYQINDDLLAKAAPGALVMHCLPAYRGMEITSEVLDGPRSIVLDQAENRLHLQKALLVRLLGRKK